MINTRGSSSEEGGFGQAHWGLPVVGSIMGGCQGDLQFWGTEFGNPFSLPHWADPAPSPYPMMTERRKESSSAGTVPAGTLCSQVLWGSQM